MSAVAFGPRSTILASGGEDRTVRVWEAKTGQRLFTFDDHGGRIRSLAFSSCGELLAGGDESKVVIWNVRDGDTTAQEWLDYAADCVAKLTADRDSTTGESGRELVVVSKRAAASDDVQQPRIFYRRESGSFPWVVAKDRWALSTSPSLCI